MARNQIPKILQNGKEFLSLTHAASLCGYNKERLRQLIRENKISGEIINGVWFIESSVLQNFMNGANRIAHREKGFKTISALKKKSVYRFFEGPEPDPWDVLLLGKDFVKSSFIHRVAGFIKPVIQNPLVWKSLASIIVASAVAGGGFYAFKNSEIVFAKYNGFKNYSKEFSAEILTSAKIKSADIKNDLSFVFDQIILALDDSTRALDFEFQNALSKLTNFEFQLDWTSDVQSSLKSQILKFNLAQTLSVLESSSLEWGKTLSSYVLETKNKLEHAALNAGQRTGSITAERTELIKGEIGRAADGIREKIGETTKAVGERTAETYNKVFEKLTKLPEWPADAGTEIRGLLGIDKGKEGEEGVIVNNDETEDKSAQALRSQGLEPVISGSATTKTQEPTIVEKVITEKVIERVIAGLSRNDLDFALSGINARILAEVSELKSLIQKRSGDNFAAIALSNKIDQLSGVTLNNVTITGTVADLKDSDIPDDIKISTSKGLSGTSATFTSNVSISGTLDVTGALTASSISFSNASTSLSSVFNTLYVGGTATTTIVGSNATSTFANDILARGIALSIGSPFLQIGGTATTTIRGDNLFSTIPFASTTALTVSGTASTTNQVFSAMTSGSVLFAGTGGLLSQDNSNLFWDDTNNRLGIGTTTPGALFSVHGSGLFSNNLSIAGLTATGTASFNAAARTSGASALWSFLGGADTGLTASTEAPDAQFNLARTKTHANGTLTLQRDFLVNAATHAFTNFGAGLITDLATLGITGAPLAGTNATTTNAHTLLLSASALNASTTNSYGLTVNANTGAGSNYAAAFLGGNVGIGTTSPYAKLSVEGQTVSSYFTATSTAFASTFPYASTTALTVSGTASTTNQVFSAMTSGSVLFAGTGGLLSQDNSNLFWDDTNNRLGIGTTTPQWLLNPTSASAAQLALSAGGGLAQWTFRNAGGDFFLATTTVAGTATTTLPALTILSSSGNVGIATSTPGALFAVSGAGYLTGNLTADGIFRSNSALASVLPYASTTALTVSGTASTTNQVFSAMTSGSVLFAGTAGLLSQDNSNLFWDDTNNRLGIGTTTPGALFSVHGSGLFSNNLSIAGLTATGTASFSAAARTSGSSALWSFVGGADTGLTAATEAPDAQFNLARTKTHANGTLTLQRDFIVNAATHAFTNFAAGLIADLATLGITGAPLLGTNATTTNAHTLYLGPSALNASTTNSYGLTVNANTEASNNYAAAFLGGNVGVASTSPWATLSVNPRGLNTGVKTDGTAWINVPISGFGTLVGAGNDWAIGFTIKKAADLTGTQRVMTDHSSGGGSQSLEIDAGGDTIGVIVNNEISQNFAAASSTTYRVLVSFLASDKKFRLYKDGVLQTTSGAMAGNIGAGSDLAFMRAGGFDGQYLKSGAILSNVVIYGEYLDATKVLREFNDAFIPSVALKGQWLMNEGSGTTVADTSGNANNGTLTGGYSWSGFPLFVVGSKAKTNFIITNDGNVGIGTTSPWGLLSVNPNALGAGVPSFVVGSSTATNFIITRTGDVGIGTTSPATLLALHGSDPIITLGDSTATGNQWRIRNGVLGDGIFDIFNLDDNASRLVLDASGNVGIGTTTPGAKLNVIGALCVDDTTPTCANSARTDGTIYSVAALSATLDLAESYPTKDATLVAGELLALDEQNSVYVRRASGTSTPIGVVSTAPGFYLGGFNDELYPNDKKVPVALSGRVPVKVNNEGGSIFVGDRITLSSVAGVGKKSTTSAETVGIALESMTGSSGTIEVFVNLRNQIVPSQLTIDASGNVGIGTLTPAYKLHVIGDVAATSFVNISTRSSKKDITYVSAAEKDGILDKIKIIQVAKYRYEFEDSDAPLRIGLIAEESPAEILSASGGGVDIYKLSTFTLSAIQALQIDLEELTARVAALESNLAVSLPSGGATTSFSLQAVLDYFAGLGVSITQAITRITNLTAGTLTIENKLCVDDVCVNKEQLKALLIQAGGVAGSSTLGVEEPQTPIVVPPVDTTAPVITIIGANPAEIAVGATYGDLGVTISDNVDSNLGYTASLDAGPELSQGAGLTIDTTSAASHTIIYKAVDNAGNIGTAQRIVNVVDPASAEATAGEPNASSTPQ